MVVVASALGWFFFFVLLVAGVVIGALWFVYRGHPWVWQRWRVLHATRPFRRFCHDVERDYAHLRLLAETHVRHPREVVNEDFERLIQVYPLARAWKQSLEHYLGDLPRYHFGWFLWMSCRRKEIEAPTFPDAPLATALRAAAVPWCRIQTPPADVEAREDAAEEAIRRLEFLREARYDPVRRNVRKVQHWWEDVILASLPRWIYKPPADAAPRDAEELLHLRRIETREREREQRAELQRRQQRWANALQQTFASFAKASSTIARDDGARVPRLRVDRYRERLRECSHALVTSSTTKARRDALRRLGTTRRLIAQYASWHGRDRGDVAQTWAHTETVLDGFPTISGA